MGPNKPLFIFKTRLTLRTKSMIRRIFLSTPLNLTANLKLPLLGHPSAPPFQSHRQSFSNDAGSPESPFSNRVFEGDRVESLVDGCDYQHWLVVMHPPENYPHRDEIIQHYVATLTSVLGNEEAAKESIYSVSTKYYYAFSCKVPENVTHKIKSLPCVKWVLPDSYLSPDENGYGGEPFIDGKVVPYKDKYHADWLRDDYVEHCKERTGSRKPRRKGREGTENPAKQVTKHTNSFMLRFLETGWITSS